MASGAPEIELAGGLAALSTKPTRNTQPRSAWRASALHFPLRKAISRRLWKIWGVGSTGLLVAAALIAAGFYADRYAGLLGPGFSHLFDIAGGRSIRLYGVVSMLLTGQLSVFVWWARSRSSKDFRRRYRVWSRFAVTCFLFSFLIGTDAQLAIHDTILWLSKNESFPHAPWVWLGPTGICALAFLLMLHRDMRECRASLAMLWMAALSWTATGAMIIAGERLGNPLVTALVQSGTALFGYWCLLMSVLLHARHVVYNSAEPPAAAVATPSRWRFPLFRSKKTAPDGEDGDSVKSSKRAAKQAAKAAADTKAKSKPSAKADAAAAKQAPTEKASAPVAAKSAPQTAAKMSSPVATKAAAPAPARPSAPAAQPVKAAAPAPAKVEAQSRPTTQTLRIDQPDEDSQGVDKDDLKGLSKRERRKLRKQFRDDHRGGSGGADDEDDDD